MLRSRKSLCVSIALLLATTLSAPVAGGGDLPAAVKSELAKAEFVYISSTRKDGSLGKKAEIWFMYHEGAVYVGSSSRSWRVKRIRWGRPQAKIWVGTRHGPSFTAVGAVVNDPEAQALLLKTYPKKYPNKWGRWEKSFRQGFVDGTRVLVKYVPME